MYRVIGSNTPLTIILRPNISFRPRNNFTSVIGGANTSRQFDHLRKHVFVLFFIKYNTNKLTHSAIVAANCDLLPARRKLWSLQICQRMSREQSLHPSWSRRWPGSQVTCMISYHFSNSESGGLGIEIALVANVAVPLPPGLDVSMPQTCPQ